MSNNIETRERLLETALNLLWRRNYNAVGVNEICKQAGVTKGSFYHHFESKAALFCQASEYAWQSTKQVVDEIMSPMNPPLEQLKRYLRFVFSRKFDMDAGTVRDCSYTFSASELGCDFDRIAQTQRGILQRSITYNRALIQTLKQADLLEKDICADSTARLFAQYFHGMMSFARIENNFEAIKTDMTIAIFRLLGLKQEYWFDPFDDA
ncbi:TetR/AcrR family transcriptional regulator [Teredinibacter turnerae]|uniref:TetR/AcrR family transcriptional regulator n=1 Tax=Teredinibacter turnerae TaxID=2426 RepID=UPI0005F7E085|nr:TetR/AcrR family transcriptional regulator [Teredinibacter turnerae]